MLPVPSGDGRSAPCFLLSETGVLHLLAQAPQSWHDGWWHQPVPAAWEECTWLPALWCHRSQILAAYSCFFQQLVFWGSTNVSAPLLFGWPQPSAFFPGPRTGLKLQAFTAAQAYVEGDGDLGCRGRLSPAPGGFLWAQRCTLALGFFGTCEGWKCRCAAWHRQVFLAVPGAFSAP